MLGHINKEKMKILREQFTIKLQQLQNHFKAQPAKPPLRTAEMVVALRNTKQTGLEGNKGVKKFNSEQSLE